MLRLDKVVKPWKESAALNDHINLYGFWNETTFLTKSGDVGMVLSFSGVDYESLDGSEQDYSVKRLEAALKAFVPGFHVYQYLFKSNRPDIPFATYDDPIVKAAIDQRRKFFDAKRDRLYQVEILYCIVLEGARSKTGVGTALVRFLSDPAGAVEEMRAQFSNDSMKTLLRTHIENDVRRLDQQVKAFTRQLTDFMQVEILNQQGQFKFFRRLLNYDDWRVAGKPQSTQFLDHQVVNSDIEAERDHLRVGDHIVRVLTMKEAITETRPLVLNALLRIPANFYVVTEWTPLPADKARKEVNKRRRHFNMSKTGFVSQLGNDATQTSPRDVLVDESKQADIENLGDCLRVMGDGQSLGDFSLTIVLYGRSRTELDQLVAEFTGVFTNADGNLFAETYNQLNAYFATVPGNYAFNFRQLYLLNTNYADLSFLFTILPGEKTNVHLGTEYLAALETDNQTPYFLNLHNGEVAHTLILGMTGSGKTTLIMQILRQIRARGESAIVYDPACEFVQRFYDENRKDVILNPLDNRCPYWGPSEELRRRAEMATGRSGAPEIKGYSQEYLDASSPRSQQIRKYMEKHGYAGHEAAHIAAHSTRDKKQILSPDEVLRAHGRIADDYGNQAEKVIAQARERAKPVEFLAPKVDGEARAHEAISYARDRSFEREAVADERLIFRDALRRGMGETTYPEVRAAFESRLAKGEFRTVAIHRHESARQITTAKMIEAEKQVIRFMTQKQDRSPQIMPIDRAIRLTNARPQLNEAQRSAVEQVLACRDQIQGIQGVAGSGKTITLAAIRQGAEASGYSVEGFAPTSRAAQQLRDSGLSAGTLQSFLAKGGRAQYAGDPSQKHLYMLDESSLASTKQMRDLLERIGPQDRILLVGDTRQHFGVEAGKPFEQLQQAGMHTAQLNQILRQKDPELLKAVEHLSQKETAIGVAILQQHGCVKEFTSPQQRFEAIARSYASQPEGTLIVSPDNASRREINQTVRAELQACGLLDPKETRFKMLVPRSEMTGADRGWATQYRIGDVLRYQRGSKELGLGRGTYAQVVATESTANLISVQKPNGDVVTYNPSRLRGIDAYGELENRFSVGDRIQMTAPCRDLDLPNRALGTIEQIAHGKMTVRMDSGQTVSFEPEEFRHFDHGYAVTSHSSQGLTADRVLINIDTAAHPNLVNSRFAYVAVSRASLEAEIYTDDARNLGQRLSGEVSKSSAVDFSQSTSQAIDSGLGQGI